MGLDQYASWTNGTMVPVGEEGNVEEQRTEFKYWRKTSHIQDWMQRLYAKKTGDTDPTNFNCKYVELTFEDIGLLIKDIDEGNLQCTSGFFFGGSYDTTECKEEDMQFAVDCLKHLYMHHKVWYSSWW